jgi:hypothetical protein
MAEALNAFYLEKHGKVTNPRDPVLDWDEYVTRRKEAESKKSSEPKKAKPKKSEGILESVGKAADSLLGLSNEVQPAKQDASSDSKSADEEKSTANSSGGKRRSRKKRPKKSLKQKARGTSADRKLQRGGSDASNTSSLTRTSTEASNSTSSDSLPEIAEPITLDNGKIVKYDPSNCVIHVGNEVVRTMITHATRAGEVQARQEILLGGTEFHGRNPTPFVVSILTSDAIEGLRWHWGTEARRVPPFVVLWKKENGGGVVGTLWDFITDEEKAELANFLSEVNIKVVWSLYPKDIKYIFLAYNGPLITINDPEMAPLRYPTE